MPSLGHFSQVDRSRTKATPLSGFCGRLTLAAAVLGEVRSLEAACRTKPALSVTDSGHATASLDAAISAYEDGRWTDAYATAAALADAGNPCAAKLALLMLRHGDRLYGVAFVAEPRRIARWAKQVLHAAVQTQGPMAVRRDLQSAADRLLPASPAPQRDPRSTSRRTASPNSITAIA